MKIITTTGFYGTGSSAITDLLTEYDNITCKGDFEVRIAHDPYGISDLEYNLVENPNRHNSSNSLKKFIKTTKRLQSTIFGAHYKKYFNNKFRIITDDYIKSLYTFSYRGSWHYDMIERGNLFYFMSRLYNKTLVTMKRFFGVKNEVGYSLLSKNEMAYGTISDKELFLKNTQLYFDRLFEEVNVLNNEFILLDQLVPPSNIARYSRYFSNLKPIIVDRDPRDIYLLEKLRWKGNVVPHYDVNVFCQWYEWTRRQSELSDNGNALKIQFEDLVYKYEETVNKIETFLNINSEHHTKIYTNFNPSISKKGTKLWEQYPEYFEDINIIYSKLSKYCYNY